MYYYHRINEKCQNIQVLLKRHVCVINIAISLTSKVQTVK